MFACAPQYILNTLEKIMLKKLLLAVATLIATMSFALAQVDVNKADQAALDTIKGVGPVTSKSIIEERKKGGNFKDWADFEKRVKGIGEKRAANLSEAGLTVNGQAKPGATPAAAKEDKKSKAGKDTKETHPTSDAAKSDVKSSDAKTGSKDAKPTASTAKDAKVSEGKDTKKDSKKDDAKK